MSSILPDLPVKTLNIVNLTKKFGDFTALKNIDMYVCPGEIVGVIGPNGAGKSTLLRLCEGLEVPDEGRVLGFDKDINVERDAMKGKVGIVLQRPKFSSYATVREVINLFSGLSRSCFDPDKLAHDLGLAIKFDEKISKLSGGQRQRLGVLVGLMWSGGLLLLDEPTSELDPQARRVVWELISKVAKENNSAVLMTTHQMEEAESLCDRIYILNHGEVVAAGAPSEIIIENCDEVLLYFTIDAQNIEGAKKHIGKFSFESYGRLLKCNLQLDTLSDGHKKIKSLLEQSLFEVLDVGLQRSNLEDVFIRLTGAHLRD